MGTLITIQNLPLELFESIAASEKLVAALYECAGEHPGDWSAALREDPEFNTRRRADQFASVEEFIAASDELVRLADRARAEDDGFCARMAEFHKDHGIFEFLLGRALVTRHGIDGEALVHSVVFGTQELLRDGPDALCYVRGEECGELASCLLDVTSADLAAEWDVPRMLAKEPYGVYKIDADSPRDIPDWMVEQIEPQLEGFRDCVRGAHERDEIILSSLEC